MRKTSIRFALLCLMATGIATFQGCYGSFALTKKVYKFNGSVGDKWLKSLLFVAMCIVPVYELSGFVDAIAFNLIEFWTGSNPVAAAQDHMDKTYADGTRVQADRLSDGRLSVHLTLPSGSERTVVLTREDNGISAADARGNWLAKVVETDHGTMLVKPHATAVAAAK